MFCFKEGCVKLDSVVNIKLKEKSCKIYAHQKMLIYGIFLIFSSVMKKKKQRELFVLPRRSVMKTSQT